MEEVREAVAAAARELAAEGLVLGTAGNLSARDGDRIAITPTGARLATVSGDQIAVVDLDGAHVSGPLAPSSELGLHLGVYRRYDAGAVVHTHAPAATALSCVLEGEVPCVHYGMLALGGAVPIAPYETFGSEALAEGVCDALEGHLAALMASHGTVTWGTGLDHAVENTRLLEWACLVYTRAASVGTPRVMSPQQLQDVVDAVVARGYGAVKPA